MVVTADSIYPHLSATQQQDLPVLIQASALPVMYDDSTHQLWHCDTIDGQMMLKLCDSHSVQSSSFWQGMTHLFEVELIRHLGQIDAVYKTVTELSPLQIPEYIASGSSEQNERFSAFLLARIVPGIMVEKALVDDIMIITLAEHISRLHQCHQVTWGPIHSSKSTAKQWPQRLQKTLKLLAEKQQLASIEMVSEAIALATDCTSDTFVPVMPDLRWDQFLQQNGSLSALVDLDAFVYGPRELELVLLEYLLNDHQARIFADHYQQVHLLPDLSRVRKSYRLLLFMMNVLGEKDVDAWMQAPTRF